MANMTFKNNLLKYLDSTSGHTWGMVTICMSRRRRMCRRFLEGPSFTALLELQGTCRESVTYRWHRSTRGLLGVYLPRNPRSFAVNRLIDTSRVSGRTQGGSLRTIDHWLVAKTNNGSRYRSISRRMTWWILSVRPTMHTVGMHIGRYPTADLDLTGTIVDTKFASESNHHRSPVEC